MECGQVGLQTFELIFVGFTMGFVNLFYTNKRVLRDPHVKCKEHRQGAHQQNA